ncbi:MAG: right-handed parallel beta-helix repeat-containing protein [Gaiellaceae bacterium]
MLRVLALLLVVASAAAVAVESRAVPASAEGPQTVLVGSDVAFAAAAARLRGSGGRIVLRPGLYRRLVIGPRSGRELRIVGSRGTRVERILFWRTTRVSLGRLTVGPIGGDALIDLEGARDIDLHDLVVTARGSGRSASILIAYARQVTIRRSVFTHCGDFSPDFVNCVLLYRGAHNVVIEDNRFHDCRGCDFIHGRFGSSLTIRRNRFDRALPCHMGRYRCGHNDLVQLFAGQWLRVEQNRFGVYREGGAQLYLTDDVDHATIVNNLFVGTDARVPGYSARMAIVVGANESKRLPYYAKIVNNTILTGYRRRDGYAGSIRMSSLYGGVRRWKRPIVANNVIALLQTSWRVCAASQRFLRNIVIEGKDCSADNYSGPADLDHLGRPLFDSLVIGLANRHYAPPTDINGRRRDTQPDIGAYEYRPGQ